MHPILLGKRFRQHHSFHFEFEPKGNSLAVVYSSLVVETTRVIFMLLLSIMVGFDLGNQQNEKNFP